MHMATGAGHAVRGGIFSQGLPVAAFGAHKRAYADGSLGTCGGGGCGGVGALGAAPMKGPGHAYRGGIFTTATPDAPYGSHLTAFADGVLGQTGPSPEDVAAASAQANQRAALAMTGLVVVGAAGLAYAAYAVMKSKKRKH